MTTSTLMQIVTTATDMLIPVTLASVAVVWARATGQRTATAVLLMVLALVWGALWTWYPPLSDLRLAPPPAGQASAMLAVLVSGMALLLFPAVRHALMGADLRTFVELGPWRAVYGIALLVLGLAGGLPPAFFVTAAAGDILVGLWSMAILARGDRVSEREVVAWNAVGVADLLHVMALGALHLRPFLVANPDLPPLNLLPLAGVPVFIVVHLLTLWAFAARRRPATT